jgi:hypothetical protein
MAGDQVIVMVQGTVKTVDKDADTCVVTPIDGGADYLDVKLEALDHSGDVRSDIVRYPELNAVVVVGLIDNDHLNTFLIKASRYESVVFLVAKTVKITASGNGNVTVDATSIQFNGGNNNGLVNIKPLVDKLNNLEKTVNDHLTSYQGHTHPGVKAGGDISAPTSASVPDSLTKTKVSDLEDTKITH